ncbi:MAG: TraB/GumN family protein [Eubacteriaceae bacterium]|nr:TraB/GumN family protein [Eubacteriaceae bacterium]
MAENHTTIQLPGKTVRILGTAHVSKDSAMEAKELILSTNPDTVCIELDEERIASIQNPDAWKNTNITDVIRQKRTTYMLATILLSSYQKRLASSFGIEAGQEMIESISAAEQVGAKLIGIDRSIRTTFMRIWQNMGVTEKYKLIYSGLLSFLDDEEITEEDLSELMGKDMLSSALGELANEFPAVKKYLVDERDMYLAASIEQAEGESVVAIVGAAHMDGLLASFGKNVDKSQLETLKTASKASKAAGWIIPVAIVAIIIATLFMDSGAGFEQIKTWTMTTGILAAIGTILAGGHPASIATSLLMAPLTTIHPLLAVGWFSGLVEAKMRKPTVGDFESLSDDLDKISGLWKNKVTRVILVIFLANLGASIGTIMGGINVIGIFKGIFRS